MSSYIDGLTATTSSHLQTIQIFKALNDKALRAWRKSRPREKNIRNWKVAERFQLQIQGGIIPSDEESPIKCLGSVGNVDDISGSKR